MSTNKKIRAALLLGCALGAGDLAVAADPAAPAPAVPAASDAAAQVKALQKQLKAVQAQLRELAEQNKALLDHQKLIDREIQQQQEQLAQQAAAQAQLNAQVQAPAGQPGAVGGVVAQSPGARGSGVQPGATQGQVAQSSAQGPLPTGAAATNSALPDNTSALPGPEAPMGASGPLASFAQNIKLWGYGEVYYTDPVHDRNRAQADLARAVFGIGYSFDSRTEFNSEYEVEHAVSSASDPGEFEVEQFYVDHQIVDAVAVRAGLFLMPFGLLNEHHEPTNFYGVQRNFVETLIIPSTWREGGFNFHGNTQSGGWLECRAHDGFRPVEVGLRPRIPTVHDGVGARGQRLGAAAVDPPGTRAGERSRPVAVRRTELLRCPRIDGGRRHQHGQGGLGAGSAECADCRQSTRDLMGRSRALDA